MEASESVASDDVVVESSVSFEARLYFVIKSGCVGAGRNVGRLEAMLAG